MLQMPAPSSMEVLSVIRLFAIVDKPTLRPMPPPQNPLQFFEIVLPTTRDLPPASAIPAPSLPLQACRELPVTTLSRMSGEPLDTSMPAPAVQAVLFVITLPLIVGEAEEISTPPPPHWARPF